LSQSITFSSFAPVSFSTSVSIPGIGNWLTVSPAAGNTNYPVTITANPAGLTQSSYSGTVILTYGPSYPTLQIPVTLTLSGSAVTLSTPSPSSLTFNFTPGSATQPPSQTLTIGATSATSVTAAVTSGSSWLGVSPTFGTTPASFTVAVNTAGLTAQTYNGSIQITAAGASNSPVNIPVTLTASSTTLTVASTALSFNYSVGASTPAAQSVSVTGTSGIAFTTSTGGTAWLSATPSGTVPSSISVSINPAGLTGLAAGQYNGTVTVTSSGASGSPASIPVTLIVSVASLTAAPAQLSFTYQASGGATPAAQTINVSDAAGVTFTATAATNLGGSWLSVTPASGNASGPLTVSVNPKGLTADVYNGTITVAAPGLPSQVINVSLVEIIPSISGIVNGASYDATGFAPGTIVSIFGSMLGPSTGSAFSLNSQGSINSSLGGATVNVEGIPATPLFVQNGQINIILPFTLNTSGQAYVEVTYNDLTSVQFNIPLVPADVQIFTADASGSGPGSILNQDSSVNSATNPAAPGSVVQVYGTGGGILGGGSLGPAAVAGAVAGNTLSWVNSQYSATVNSENAVVTYAGSAPGLVYGVYQFNVQLPADLPSGAQKIVLTVGGSASQPDVTVFVK
jgi:uncharacterized protein (TIGR03437 family)